MNANDTTLLEVLKLARDLVINEHTDRRAHIHNQWVFDSEFLLKTKRVRLQYPPIPPYPTEAHIIERAQSLMDFLNNNKVSTIPEATKSAINAAETTKIEESVAPSSSKIEEYQYSSLPVIDTTSLTIQPVEMPSIPRAIPKATHIENTLSGIDASNIVLPPIIPESVTRQLSTIDPVASVTNIFQPTPTVTDTSAPLSPTADALPPETITAPISAEDPVAAIAKIFQATQPVTDVVASPLPLVNTVMTESTSSQVPPVDAVVTENAMPQTPAFDPVAAVAKIFQATQPVTEVPAPVASSRPVSPQAAIAKIFQTPTTTTSVLPTNETTVTKPTNPIADIFSPSTVVRLPDRLPEQTTPQTATTDNDIQTSAQPDNIIPIPSSDNTYNNNVAELLKQQSEKSNKLLPAMLKKIEDIRSGWNTNPAAR